jgi:hypothetical protein
MFEHHGVQGPLAEALRIHLCSEYRIQHQPSNEVVADHSRDSLVMASQDHLARTLSDRFARIVTRVGQLPENAYQFLLQL